MRADGIAQRLRDLRPATRLLAAEWQRETNNAFARRVSPYGESFPPLALSTLQARARALPGARRRSKKTGRLTRAARAKRSAAITQQLLGEVPGAGYLGLNTRQFTPLIDSGRARQATNYEGTETGVALVTVRYLLYHTKGFQKGRRYLPKRNVLVIEQDSETAFHLIPPAHDRFLEVTRYFVLHGEAGLS